MTNADALEQVLAAAPNPGALGVELARTLARELDRQAAEHRGINANLVKEYREVLEELLDDDEAQRGQVVKLSQIRDASAG